ncbi:serine-pyruvate aminotransferase [Vibrio ishigakensis]|uniref:Serine-pyruvate aminotransferase n=1 Tax=Vibrio ishigakensis TaxID=1481914 RepID=A0A0B8QGC1_9VIBR|nr:serine-pyruvate aminotransferase [Vibrio ishigakensis]
MNQVQSLYRGVFHTQNQQTMLVDGTARSGIEAVLVSVLKPGDKVLIPVIGRFGHLLCEIANRVGAVVRTIDIEWGEVCLRSWSKRRLRSSNLSFLQLCRVILPLL